MRVAICISGLMRTFEQTAESLIKNIAAPNQADIFISTYNFIGNAKHNYGDGSEFRRPLDRERVISSYGDYLKGIEVHDYDATLAALPSVFYPGMVSMYWNIQRCHQLALDYAQKNRFEYDLFVRCRADWFFHSGFQIQGLGPAQEMVGTTEFSEFYSNDQFAIADKTRMDTYANLFDWLPIYYGAKELLVPPGEDPTKVAWPESALRFHLKRNNIGLWGLPITHELVRGEGNFS